MIMRNYYFIKPKNKTGYNKKKGYLANGVKYERVGIK